MLVESSDKTTREWRTSVQAAAMEAYSGPLLDMPLEVEFHFCFRRPKGHYGTGRNAGRLKHSAPSVPAIRPDITKLIRSTEDALTHILWADDALIVRQAATKEYVLPNGSSMGSKPGAMVAVWEHKECDDEDREECAR